jgi:hypothetical protein
MIIEAQGVEPHEMGGREPMSPLTCHPQSALVRAAAVVLAAGLAVLPAAAQVNAGATQPPHVRLTGTRTFEVPGVIYVDSNRVSGAGYTHADRRMVRLAPSAAGRPIVVPRGDTRLLGLAVGISGDAVVVQLDDTREEVEIPIAAIAQIEVANGPSRPHHRVIWTVLSGIGAFYGSAFIAFSQCFLGPCSTWWSVFILGSTAAATAGTAYALRAQHWKRITLADLTGRLSPPSPGGTPTGGPAPSRP